jgi:hypothetical protein
MKQNPSLNVNSLSIAHETPCPLNKRNTKPSGFIKTEEFLGQWFDC